MTSSNLVSSTIGTAAGLARLIQRLLSVIEFRDLEFFTKWTRELGLLLRKRLCSVSYEVLEYESSLELKDPRGKVAIYRKREKVRFLVDQVVAFRDEFWGEGNLVKRYRSRPGKVVDFYQEGSKHYALISLREAKHVGDIVEFNIERRVKDGFNYGKDWREIEINHPTRRLQLDVIFPKERPCLDAWVAERRGRQITPLQGDRFSLLPDGRQVVSWEKSNPRLHEVYTFKWKW